MFSSSIIAIVDDDPGVRGSLESLLRSAGITSRTFASAEDLLASDEAPALVVTDLHMPGMSGLELLGELARRGWACPTMLMTAYPSAHARDEAEAAGATAFLTKPIDPDAFLDAVERAAG